MALTDDSVRVKGLRELQSSMRKAGGEAARDLKRDLRTLGKTVLADAKSNAPVGPRPKRSSTKPLAASLRISVNQRGVSVYSNAEHAYVQDRGGRVGKGAVITRASASGYMTKAVADARPRVNRELEQILDRLDAGIHT